MARVEEAQLDQNSIVVVMETGGRPFGLLAAQPVDVVEAAVEIDPHTLRQPGVVGSAILRGRTTLVLDPCDLSRVAWTTADPGAGPETQPALGGFTVLIAEDSAFFREQVTRLIEEAGCKALAAADGQEAWEILQQRAGEVALVVTDIEMPRLDGLELTRRIRAGHDTARLPVVMLTSLAGQEDIERGCAAGASAYCIKLDRDQLLSAVRRLLAGSGGEAVEAGEDPGLAELSRRLRAETELAPTIIGERQ